MPVDPAFLASLRHIEPADARLSENVASPVDKSHGFDSALREATEALLTPHEAAAQAVQDFTRGADGELHKTMLAVERSDIALKYFVSVRNRCLEAYREIMRMGN